MPYVQIIANKIGVTQSVNGSWIQAIAEATFSGGTVSTPGGITQSVQYNDGSGGFTGDASFTRSVTGPSQSFFVNSVIGTDEMAMGTADWSSIIGIPVSGSGLLYTSGDIFSTLFVGDATQVGGSKGLFSFNQDDLSGDTSVLSVSYEGVSISIDTASASNAITIEPTITELVFNNNDYKAEVILEATGSMLSFKDETGPTIENNIIVNTNGVAINTLPDYDDDTAAGVGGLITNDVYQTTGSGASPLNVAGIMMIKQ